MVQQLATILPLQASIVSFSANVSRLQRARGSTAGARSLAIAQLSIRGDADS